MSDKYDNARSLSPSRWLLFWISAFIACAFIWSLYSVIDEVSRAPGQVIPSSKTQLVQTQDGGVLEDLLVEEGDYVIAGQVLAKIDKTRAQAAFLETRAQVAALSAQVTRLDAELLNSKPVYEELLVEYPSFAQRQSSLLAIRQSAFREEIEALRRIQDLAQRELELHRPLLTTGELSRLDLIKLERQIADVEAKIVERNNTYLQGVQEELADVGEKLEAARQLLIQRRNLLDQTELRAPSKIGRLSPLGLELIN